MKEFISILIVIVLLLGGLSACGNSGNSSGQDNAGAGTEETTYHWRMALNSATGDNAYDIGVFFADKIAELSEDRIKVELFGGAALGTTSEVLEGMSAGVADVMVESIGTLATLTEKANIDAMPYLYSGYDHFMNVWSSALGEEMRNEIGEAANKKLLGAAYRGPRIVTATKRMSTVDDFAGFKLRAPNLEVYIKTWQWMGSAPTPMPVNEVYTALQQGTVEGQENPAPDNLTYGFDEVCPYWIRTNHVYSCNVVIMDLNYFNSLPSDIQAMIEEAANYATSEMSKLQLERDASADDEIKAAGCEIIEVDQAAFAGHFTDFASENFPYLADWVEEIRAMDTSAS